jgi:hypothetical protein
LASWRSSFLLCKSAAKLGDGGGAVGFVEDGAGDDEPVYAGVFGAADRFGVDAAVDFQPLVRSKALS